VDPQQVFCPNPDCPARGQTGQDNIGIHSQKEQRYICRVCRQTFAASTGTVFYRLRTAADTVTLVITLLAYGCPVPAIVAAFGLDERTIADWRERAGQHCERVHQHLVEQPRDLGQVQADEIRVKTQGGIVWLAMALQVSTRLWLGCTLSARRDLALIAALIHQVRACALCRPLLFCMDGLSSYVQAIRLTFREPLPRAGRTGRPRLRPWDGIYIAQVVKQYAGHMVIGIERRIVQGTQAQIQALIQHTQGGGGINTAYIERLNATFRARLVNLVRRGRALARQSRTLYQAAYLMGTIYNFCTDHESLRLAGLIGGHKWLPRTPAMAAGLADHRWTVYELLAYRVPLSTWSPPRRRGRKSQAVKALIARWCS
jgi:transposase-like protein